MSKIDMPEMMFWLVVGLLVLAFAGEPDLMDAIIELVQACARAKS